MILKERIIKLFSAAVFLILLIAFGSFFNFQENLALANTPVVFNNTATGNTGTIQSWTVPATGDYQITAYGAGFDAVSNQKGAKMSGEFSLTEGQVLKILVGQIGENVRSGSGGSFVTLNDNTPLIIAGGAGGYEHLDSVNIQGTTEALGNRGAQTADRTSAAGEGGDYTGTSSAYPAGGGGLNSQGRNKGSIVSHGGRAFIDGGAGGTGATGYNGGFGGGAGVANSATGRVSGGGGYSGGMGSYGTSGNYGGGGGSYNSGANQVNESGVRSGHGLVEITLVSEPVVVSETGYRINTNNTDKSFQINPHSICKSVTNSSFSKDYFIPVKTLDEWNAFINAAITHPYLDTFECGSGDACATYYGTGIDGALTVSSSGQVINKYAALTGGGNVGSNVITVHDGSLFSVGDEIMLLQSRGGSSTAGNYEFNNIQSISGDDLTLTSSLTQSFDTEVTGTQVVTVPNYTDVNIPSGTSITSSLWIGGFGGVVVFRATGSVYGAGSIEVNEDGFRGAQGQTADFEAGYPGESTTGMSYSVDASQSGWPAGGGAGGRDSLSTSAWGGGGTGGGYGTAGDPIPTGGASYCPPEGSYLGGSAYGVADLTKFNLGSGGGGGGRQNDGNSGHGGSGGGAIMVLANDISLTGSILANGQDGGLAPATAAGCGGSGSGGSIYLFSSTNSCGSIQAQPGAVLSDCGSSRCNSSSGGVGRIAIYSDTFTGSTSPTPYTNNGCTSGGGETVCGAGYYLSGEICAVTPGGYYSPDANNAIMECGSVDKWSTAGQGACSTVSTGYYTTGGTTTTRTGQTGCEEGYWCSGGVRTACGEGLTSPALSDSETDCTCVVGGSCELAGGTGCATGNVTGYYSTVDKGDGTCTITFQPDPSYSKDTYINKANATTNYGSSTILNTHYNAASTSYVSRTALEFDVEGVLTGITDVNNATLSIYREWYNLSWLDSRWHITQYTHVHRMTTPWQYDTATWNSPWTNAGGDFISSPTDSSSHVYDYTDWKNMDVTSDVNGFLAGTYSNYGWMILGLEGDYGQGRYHSSDNTSIFHPSLSINYNAGTGGGGTGVYDATCTCVEGETTCGAGYYDDGGICALTPAGYYSPDSDNGIYECGSADLYSSAGAASCTTVSSGYFTTGGTSTTRTGQSICTCGTYCSSGWQYDCSAGYYGSTDGLTSGTCTGSCGSNDYFSTSGSCSCTQVTAGYYTTGGTSTTRTGQTICEVGYYCPGPGDGGRYACPAGYTTSSTGSTSSADCSVSTSACGAGYYNDGTGCVCVGDGYYSPTDDDSRDVCDNGTYSTGCSSSCTSCDGGTYTANDDLPHSSCSTCSAGYYSTSGSSSCSICLAGTYSTSGSSSCTDCVIGTYSDTSGSGSCTDCPAGYTTPSSGSDSETDCSVATSGCGAGYYNDGTGCVCVGDGYYSAADDDTRTQCSAGSYATGCSSSCTSCDAGTYSATVGSSSCTSCDAGTYNTTTGNSSCSACPAGKYCTGGTNNTCCPDGTYRTTTGAESESQCTNCAAGTEGAGTCQTSNTCTSCAAGEYSSAGSASCSTCSAGTYSSSGSSSCSSCACSTYSTSGSSSCSTCTNGYCCSTGSTSTTGNTCASGYNSTTTNCSYTCGAGQYDSNRDGVCGTVEVGYYSPSNDYKRYACQSGYTTSSTGSTSSSDCSVPTSGCGAGYYYDGSACTCVGDGYYSPSDNNSRYVCDGGKYCTGCSGSTSTCSAGTYTPNDGQPHSSCTTCSAGSYNTSSGSSSCSTCPAGKYCTGGTNNTCCPDGRYRSSTGGTSLSSCSSCPAGTAGGGTCQTSSSTCTTCSAGTYNTSSGSASCSTCPAGKYCTGGTNNTCCPDGTYRSSTGGTSVSSCYSCPSGTEGTGTCKTSSSSCATCPAGEYSSSRSASCSTCACSTYSSSGSSSCSTCQNGYCCSTGSTSSTDNACTSGYNSTTTNCSYTCGAGLYDSNRNATCETVPAGSRSPANDYRKYTCPAGTYSTSGSSSCTDCAGGYYGSSSGMTSSTCSGCCVGGHYCPPGSTSSTENRCPSGTDSPAYSDSSSDCAACPSGTFYMDQINYKDPVDFTECENNYNNCVTCIPGSYCTNATRYHCPAGKYNSSSGSSSSSACTTCPEGSYCDGTDTYATDTW